MSEAAEMVADPVAEIAARRAVEGVGEQIVRDGGSPDEADAFTIALRRYLLDDVSGAREALSSRFSPDDVEAILSEFAQGVREGKMDDPDRVRAARAA